MVKDIDAGAAGSNPDHLTVHEGVLYFTASDGQTGYELWRSDGTAAGTTLVGDVAPGADSSSPPVGRLDRQPALLRGRRRDERLRAVGGREHGRSVDHEDGRRGTVHS